MSTLISTLLLGANLPIEWGYHGCWTDYGRRKLAGPSYVDINNMTQESCAAFCQSGNYAYAGVEYGHECYCGHVLGTGSEVKDYTECNIRCPGLTDEACGGASRLSIFFCGLLNTQATNPGPAGTQYVGCLTDNVYARALSVFQASEDDMTVIQCTLSCKNAGYRYAGLQYGRECFCGNSMDNNAAMTDEGCDMTCAGNSSEFCGGAERLNLYSLDSMAPTITASPVETTSATPVCTPVTTSNNGSYIFNGGFEQGLTNWLAVAYNPDRPFDIGLTNDALEGCNALTVVPKSGSTALSAHAQISTTLVNLQPSNSYTIELAIGHRSGLGPSSANSIPKYTVRMSNRQLAYGPVCGFTSTPCPLTGLNNSTYMVVNMQFQADSPTENLTLYLSWYNGNLDVPLYLDSVSITPSDSVSMNTVAMNTVSTNAVPMNTVPLGGKSPKLVSVPLGGRSIVPESTKPSASADPSCSRVAPISTRWETPPPDVTDKIRNHGFEDGLTGWTLLSNGGTFDVTTTNQSLEGCLAASIKPTSFDHNSQQSLILQNRMANLNASHEWYTVDLYIGHADHASNPPEGTSPIVTMKYKNAISGDSERPTSLCGFDRTSRFYGKPRPCDLIGAEGAQYQRYGMDVRAFLSTEGKFTNATELEIEVRITWPVGAAQVPVFVDGFEAWEIEWGSISK